VATCLPARFNTGFMANREMEKDMSFVAMRSRMA